ncbi:MAG: hypothetical protein J6T16_03800 [Opitutales bacterium]|nr:hypothetical protein [Opitutales bacterium]
MKDSETFVWLMILLSMLALSLVPNLYYLFKSKDDLYSDYRNTIDIGRQDFERRYKRNRVIWAVVPFVILILMIIVNLCR